MAQAKDKKTAKTRRPSALKRDLQSERRNLANRSFKSKVHTALRSLEDSVVKGEQIQVKERLSTVYSLIDKGVKTGVFKQNKADRTKSRLSLRLNAKAAV